eukprot:7190879-Ditylum_brightwellii.AAC.1
MDKEGFAVSSSTLKEFIVTCVLYKECKLKGSQKTSEVCKSHSKRGGKHKAKHRASKNSYCDWGQDSPQHHSYGRGCHYCKYHGYCNCLTDECRTTINHCKGSMHHEREDRSCQSKKVRFSSGKAKSCEALSNGNKDLHAIINEKNSVALSHQEKKDLKQFEALSISSDSDNSNSGSRVSDTSNEEMNAE